MSILETNVLYNDNPQSPDSPDNLVKILTQNIIYLKDNKLHMNGSPILFKITKPPDENGLNAEYELTTDEGIEPQLTITQGVI